MGLAVSDMLKVLAQPLSTLTVSAPADAVRLIRQIVQERAVERIVVGLPLNMDGSEGPQAKAARQFAALLRDDLSVPVDLLDERLSTVRAERAMLSADMSRAKRDQRRDKMAAQFILQAYLDRRAVGKEPPAGGAA
jgi:putative Holliday junction resolvase